MPSGNAGVPAAINAEGCQHCITAFPVQRPASRSRTLTGLSRPKAGFPRSEVVRNFSRKGVCMLVQTTMTTAVHAETGLQANSMARMAWSDPAFVHGCMTFRLRP